jgi:serine/threonine-protein kinase
MSNPEDWKKWEGRVDGKFPLRQWLGGSDHSAVFLTERPGHTEKVAIKLIAADGAEAERQLSRWRAAAQLSHPHLMRIFDAGRCRLDGNPLLYLVMEYAEEDLAEILPQRPLAPAEVTDLLPALLDALSFLHGKGFVHGRVKPSNVHAMGDELKLSADQIVSSTETSSARGRRDVYDAPETAEGIVTPAGDVWSIGVTLVAALTQNVTFQGDAAQRDPDPPASVPQPFRGIARECLHLDPKRRCSLEEIQARLQPEGRSVPAELEAPAPPRRRAGRGPGCIISISAILLAVVLVGFVVFHHREKNASPPSATATGLPAPEAVPQSAPQAALQSAPQSAPQAAPETAPAPAPKPPVSEPIAPSMKAITSRGEVVHQVLPDVPQSARSTITGTVKVSVRVEVDSSGKVTAATLKSPGPSKYFAGLALRAAQDWEFSPAEVDGKPTASAWLIQFRFKRAGAQALPQRLTGERGAR